MKSTLWPLAAILGATLAAGESHAVELPCTERFTAGPSQRLFNPLVAVSRTLATRYRALRQMEAGTERGMKGWLSAVTEFDSQSGLRYQVMHEGGSERIRNRVLRRILETEIELSSKEEASKAAFTDLNYVFQSCQRSGDLLKVSLAPRRKESRLVDGELFLKPEKGLVRLEGRLAKSPSFWIRRVDVVWQYQAIEGVTLPVRVESTADVRFVGKSTFAMTYDYEMVNGRPIAEGAPE